MNENVIGLSKLYIFYNFLINFNEEIKVVGVSHKCPKIATLMKGVSFFRNIWFNANVDYVSAK